MIDIVRDNLSQETIKLFGDRNWYVKTEGATFVKEDRSLEVKVSTNVIIPFSDIKKLESILLNVDESLRKVDFIFDFKELVMDRDEAASLYLPYITKKLNGAFSPLGQGIIAGSGRILEDAIVFNTLGESISKDLNDNWCTKISAIFAKDLGIDMAVRFQNDHKSLKRLKESLNEAQEREKQRLAKERSQMEKKLEVVKSAGSPTGYFPTTNKGKSEKPVFRRKKEAPAEGNLLFGSNVTDSLVSMSDISVDRDRVSFKGILFDKDGRKINNGKYIMSLFLTDKKTSCCVKLFVSDWKYEELNGLLKSGMALLISGRPEWDRYDNAVVVMADGICMTTFPKREDNCQIGKRVELHAHTKMSSMDGLNEVEDLVTTAANWGQPAVAITDHGVVQGFPDAASCAKKLASDKNNPRHIKIIYGLEGYVFDDSDCINDDGSIDYKKKGTNHIILLAASQEGLKNIYKLVSYSHLHYFYRKPRLPKSIIEKHREGIIIGSACEAGEVFRSVVTGASDEELEKVASFYDYLEVQPIINNRFMVEKKLVNSPEDLRNFNRRIVELGDRMGKLVVATTDAHYQEPEAAIYRNILMAGMGYKDAENGQGLYMRTTEEMLDEFSYLGEEKAKELVITNSNKIANMISPDIMPVPKDKYPPKIEGAEETLRRTCMARAREVYGENLNPEIAERLETELSSIINNGYAVMYVSAQMLVKKSLEDGYLVGSRGSVGSSFAATMAGITEVNPLEPHYICPNCKHFEWGDIKKFDCGVDMPEKSCPKCSTIMNQDGFTIPFATFLGFDGDKEPDIDLNFAGEYQGIAHKYVGDIFGEKNVYKAGTVSTVADKTAYGYVLKFSEEKQIPINQFEVSRLAKGCTGVKKTTGQHPGGIIIVPDDHEIYEFCPVQRPANDTTTDIVTTHFDYHKIDKNLLKLDILGHTVPSMIRQLQDITGVDPMTIPLNDKKVLSIFNSTEALDIKMEDYPFVHGSYAIPEFGTHFVRNMLTETKPSKFADLVRISGFSHGTDVWQNNAQIYIRDGIATMSEVISTRDDIMNYLILKDIEKKTAFTIMEHVRKNKPLTEEELTIMKEHGVPDWYIDSCIKIQYMFPRAHAVAYVMMAFRLAWYKVYYPQGFYAAYFTSIADSFNAETILMGADSVKNAIKTIQDKGLNASAKEVDELTAYEVALEMYARGYEFENAKLGISHPSKFWVNEGKVILPFVAICGVGETAAQSLYSAYEEKPFRTIEEASIRAKLNKNSVEALINHGVFAGIPESDQLSFFM